MADDDTAFPADPRVLEEGEFLRTQLAGTGATPTDAVEAEVLASDPSLDSYFPP
jgi:hypothetical protein